MKIKAKSEPHPGIPLRQASHSPARSQVGSEPVFMDFRVLPLSKGRVGPNQKSVDSAELVKVMPSVLKRLFRFHGGFLHLILLGKELSALEVC